MPDERLQITDAANMRALAHPARLASLERLMRVGPATATELGELVDLTPSAMSYHLRALERAGLIETAPSRGDGRERVWRSVHEGPGWHLETPDDGSEESRLASAELLRAAVALEELVTRGWVARTERPDWNDDGVWMSTALVVTQAELEELSRQISEIMTPYKEQNRRGQAPDGAVDVRAFFKAFPTD